MNIKVAIRVRPFNQREVDLKTDLCVKMTPKQTFLLNDSGETDRTFAFDHCFWSHDDFTSDATGYNNPSSKASPYADQKLVYNALGQDVLQNAINGYHCCIFAYGQTGSGKSYSIFGYDQNKGIVPMICDELLNGKTLINDDKKTFSLSISMLEIYNERVQDLLIAVSRRPKAGLKVRENNKLGVFVEDLIKKEVSSYSQIEEVIETGNKNKTLGSTLMNATSSRAHTIITLELVQKETTAIKTTQKDSVIHLVDLAGSEKVAKTDAKGDRLKEACSINKSLTVLGIVIHQLYLKSEGEKVVVSYRDSVLTRILQNSLGGNSKTTMICAISPARDNYDETLSTLRYADQAKKIKQHAQVNESETDKLIRELMEENEKLKAQLGQMNTKKDQAGMDDVSHQIRELENVIQYKTTMFKTGTSVRDIAKAANFGEIGIKPPAVKLDTVPHMLNLNEDPLLNGKIIYNFLESPYVLIGRQSDSDQLDEMRSSGEKKVILNGVGIIEDHARIVFIDGTLQIITSDPGAASHTFINGDSLDQFEKEGSGYVRQLVDLDRIILGTSSTFLIRLLGKNKIISPVTKIGGKDIDWEYCQMEKFKLQEKTERDKMQTVYLEKENALKSMEKQLKTDFEKEKGQYEEKMRSQREDYERMIGVMQKNLKERESEKVQRDKMAEFENLDSIKVIQNEQKTKELEYQVRLNTLHQETQLLKQIQSINFNLEKKLINYYHKIKEANYVAQELNRNIEFVPFVASLNLLASLNQKTATPDLIINVKVINHEDGWINYWSLEKFDSRLILMREAIEYFFSHNKISYNEQNDPFWDPEEFFLFGQSFCIAKNVLYRFEITHKVGILGYEGDIGYIVMHLIPIDDEGRIIDEEEMEEEIEEPDDLIRKNMSCHYRVNIEKIIIYDINVLKNKTAYVSYEVMTLHDLEEFSTPRFKIRDNQTDLSYNQAITLPRVNDDIIDYYMHKNIQLKLFVDHIEQVQQKGKNAPPVINKEPSMSGANRNSNAKSGTDKKFLPKIDPKKASLNKSSYPRKTTVYQEKSHSSNICNVF